MTREQAIRKLKAKLGPRGYLIRMRAIGERGSVAVDARTQLDTVCAAAVRDSPSRGTRRRRRRKTDAHDGEANGLSVENSVRTARR